MLRVSTPWNQHVDGRATSTGREVLAWYGPCMCVCVCVCVVAKWSTWFHCTMPICSLIILTLQSCVVIALCTDEPSLNGRSRLVIRNALKHDDGTYMCVAENPAGVRRAIAGVRVKGTCHVRDSMWKTACSPFSPLASSQYLLLCVDYICTL